MRVRKPQSKEAGGNLTKSLKPKVKNSKQNSAAKQSLLTESSTQKSVPAKKSNNKLTKAPPKTSKQKDDVKHVKKLKSVNKSEKSEAMGTNTTKGGASKKVPKKTTNDKKPTKEIALKSSKELKNLDIQLTGYSSQTASDSDTDKVINASICEIVKTKARAASSIFNASGNRSPLLTANSPGPSAAKVLPKVVEKSTKTELKPVKDEAKKPVNEPKPIKDEAKKATNETLKKKKLLKVNKTEQKVEKKIANKKQLKMEKDEKSIAKPAPKKKPTIKSTNDSIEKSIEIKTDDSKSLIDSITEVINEVVKQYNDSAASDKKPLENQEKSIKSTKSQVKKKKPIKSMENKVSKANGEKLLNQRKLDAISNETSDLVIDNKNAIKSVSKKKQKEMEKIDVKTGEKQPEIEKPATKPEPKSKVNKLTKKVLPVAKIELKGSKIIKMASKTKKKPVKKAVKKVPPPKKLEVKEMETTNKNELSEDDDLSLNELKAQLTNDSKKSPAPSRASVKSSLIGPAIKQKYIKKTLKAIPLKASEKKGMKALRKDIKPDVYDFQESGHSSEDALYIHKKNKAEQMIEAKKKEDETLKKLVEENAKKPIKKRIATPTKDVKVTNKAKANKKPNNSDSDDKKSGNKSDESDASKAASEEKPKKILVKTRAAVQKRKLAAKNRRMKLFGFYSGPKRHRMASLNALAKVQCLYENESRTAQELGFVKEPQNVQRMKTVVTETENHSVKEEEKREKVEIEKKEKKAKVENEVKPEKDDNTVSERSLRKAPGTRGEGSMWEMDSSLDESDRDDDKQVSDTNISHSISLSS